MDHGVYVEEQPSGVKPPVRTLAGLTVAVGLAPVNAGDLTFVNKPGVFYTLAEYEAKCGPLTDNFDFTLHEIAKRFFSVDGVAPLVCINVLDPENEDHLASVVDQSHQLVDGEVQLQVYGGPDEPLLGIIKSSVIVKVGATVKALGTDYTLEFDDDGYLVVSIPDGSSIADNAVILASFDYLDPSLVVADDIIGGYSGGVYTGLEVVKQVYPRLRLVPGFLTSPKWSQTPEVAARMGVIARSIPGNLKCQALVDLSTDAADIPTYADAPAWKSDNGFNKVGMIACWPKSKNGDDVYHASTVFAATANVTDAANGNTPHVSPSNKLITGTSAVLDDGTEVLLDVEQANALNGQGIVTLLNGFNGWKLWGNRTAAYPATTDPKDAFIPIRRMFDWIGNTIILTTDANVDAPINRRQVDLVKGTVQSFLNGLIAQGALVDGKIEFRADENSTTDLADGKIKWHETLTPPSPAEKMTHVLEYDSTALAALFA
jgi:phage tail sheath protein FI